MRVTQHNGRAGKNGVYSAKHNDRNFTSEAEHIDQSRSDLNRYWRLYKDEPTFEDCEARFYREHFSKGLQEKNERYIKQGHRERVQTMDDYRGNEKSCPEETIIQLGKMGDDIDSKKLFEVVANQVAWEQKRFPNARYLDVALHRDEEGQDHIHLRKVWVGHDKAGNEVVGQKKALDEMGVEAPDPEKAISKYNNQKQTYSRVCREHLIEMVREYYPEIEPFLELAPKEASKVGMDLLEYQREQELQKLQELQLQLEQARGQIDLLSQEKAEYDKKIRQAEESLKKAQESLKSVEIDKSQLKEIKSQIKAARKELKDTLDLKAKASVVKVHHFGEKKDLVTYHKNSLETVEAIGREAYEHMQEAHADLQEVARREQKVADKEKAIEPLHQEAKELRAKAQDYLDRQEGFILGTARNLANAKIDELMGPATDSYTKRLENFVDSYTVDGKSLLDIFEEQEQDRSQSLHRSIDDWDDIEL